MRKRYPRYSELQRAAAGRPAGTSWGLFTEPGRGAPSFVESTDVVAAAALVKEGIAFGLDYPVDAFDPGMSVRRERPAHVIFAGHACHRDDYLDGFYLQGSSQVDGLRHRRSDEHGFYEGVPDEAIVPGRPELGVQVWADEPIVARGVLIDVAALREERGEPIDHGSGEPLSYESVAEVVVSRGVELRPGDVVMVRTGWAEWFLGLSAAERRSQAATKRATGLRQQREFVEWAWDGRFALLASDAFAVEVLPVVPDSPFRDSAPDDQGMMHQEFLAKLGMPLGELWRLGPLARGLASRGRHDCLITVKPLNVVGGVGSPANATAVI